MLLVFVNVLGYVVCLAFFQHGSPIYSAKSVRFRMGHPKSKKEISIEARDLPLQKPVDDKFVWTYTSPVYPMIQVIFFILVGILY